MKIVACAILIVSILLGVYFVSESLKKGEAKVRLGVDAYPMMAEFQTTKHYKYDCIEEHELNLPDDEDVIAKIQPHDIANWSNKGLRSCPLDAYVGIGEMAVTLYEAKNIPIRATVPYELIKKLLNEGNNVDDWQCKDAVEAIATACPKIVSRFVK